MASLFDPWLVTGKNGRHRFRPMDDDDKRAMFRVLAEAATLDECQLWPSNVSPSGYGQIRYEGRNQPAHHVALELHRGAPLPPGFVAAHWLADYDPESCSRACCNWIHLDAMTAAANTLAGGGLAALNARATHCPAGHLYDKTYTRTDGYRGGRPERACSICKNLFERARRRRLREQQEAIWLGLAEKPFRPPTRIN